MRLFNRLIATVVTSALCACGGTATLPASLPSPTATPVAPGGALTPSLSVFGLSVSGTGGTAQSVLVTVTQTGLTAQPTVVFLTNTCFNSPSVLTDALRGTAAAPQYASSTGTFTQTLTLVAQNPGQCYFTLTSSAGNASTTVQVTVTA